MLQGHVDCTAILQEAIADGDSVRLSFEISDASLLRYLIEKGFVAIDGASLTLTFVDDSLHTFGVMLIQHTQQKITLSKKKIGSKVNIEVDMVGKYVEKSLVGVEKIVEEVLRKKGIV